ncbi:MAG TPA: IPT/TIG domain-containing protein, partial [Nakamurella sp.]
MDSVSPAAGSTAGGTTVTIIGSGFTGATQVTFGTGNPGSGLLVQSDTQITVASPAGPAGAADVIVTTPIGASSAGGAQFTYAAPTAPTVAGVSPASGVLGGGTLVTLTGTGLAGTTAVNFGGNPGVGLVIASDVELQVFSPAGAAGAVGVSVVTPQGTSPAGPQFTYAQTPPPQVTGVSPSGGGLRGGTPVTVTGSGFTGASAVNFGAGNPGTGLSVLSDTELTVTSPAAPGGASGAAQVTVTTPAGSSPATDTETFTYLLQVTGVSPASGQLSGGTVVTVSGSGFTGATAVDFGASPGTGLSVQSDTQLTVTSPPGAGTVDVTVITPQATSTPNADARFGYEPTPQLYLRVWQRTATAISSVTSAVAEGVGVVGRLPLRAPITSPLRGPTDLPEFLRLQRSTTATYSLDGTGIDVTVTAPSGGFHVGDYWCFAVRSMDPATVYPARYLTGGQPPEGPRTWICPLAIVTWAPDGTATAASLVPQFWNLVTLTNAVLTNVKLPTPVITAVSPATGPPGGGTLVTVTGTGLTGASTVYFGPDTNPGTALSVHDDTRLTVTSPAGSGAVDLRVVTAGGISAVVPADRFGYVGVTALSPAIGSPAGGTAVTVSGSGFTGASAVEFGTLPGTGLTVVSDTEITVTAPAGS